MAEGWAHALKSGILDAHSAGVAPHGMNPLAVKAMGQAGVDIGTQRSKHVDELNGVAFDFVVTVCDHANETCPVFNGKTRRIHVGFDDPPRLAQDALDEDDALRHYRRVRDEIRDFVASLDTKRLNELADEQERN
jgi:arsenate reductase